MVATGILAGLFVVFMVGVYAVASVFGAMDNTQHDPQNYDTEFDVSIRNWAQMQDRWSE